MSEGKFPLLNLPAADLRIKEEGDNLLVWDAVRKKHLILTPEEWVRQHFIHLMINQLKYPASLFKVEKELYYNQKKKRTDIEVLDRNGNTFILVECKAPSVSLNQKTLEQASVYNAIKKSKFLAVTNGFKHYIWQFDALRNDYKALREFPEFLR